MNFETDTKIQQAIFKKTVVFKNKSYLLLKIILYNT